jgi:hypothetical protein
VILLVKSDDSRRRNDWLSYVGFFVITVMPWVVTIWLLWPRW